MAAANVMRAWSWPTAAGIKWPTVTRLLRRSLSTKAPVVAEDDTTRTSANLFQQPKENPPGVARLVSRYASIPVERTRCFSIIAHIDHGKSTLADKLLQTTGNIWPTTKNHQQVLDTLEVERTRGITVKAQSASMVYTNPGDGLEYLLNLIDTPGHVDFSFEVARSLAACQGALLLVDCSQGVQAQTVANYTAAVDAGLKIVPVLTKIDLPTADPEPALAALEGAFGIPHDDVLWTSAKSGAGISEVLPAVISRLPPPGLNSKRDAPLRCLLFDSWYDEYRGVVCSVLVVDGVLRPGDVIVAAHSGDKFTVQELGLMAPLKVPIGAVSGPHAASTAAAAAAAAAAIYSSVNEPPGAPSGASGSGRKSAPAGVVGALSAGHIGYMIAGMRAVKQAVVGDTFSHASAPQPPLPGFRPAKPMVFASLYPVDSGDFNALTTAVDRLTLNDASVSVERESSTSLGFGLRCGFLGLLHMDVFHQRLSSEWSMPVIITAPMVRYRITLHSGEVVFAERPADFPAPNTVQQYEEPMAHVSIMAPEAFLSPLMSLLADRRGVQEDITFLTSSGGAANSGGGSAGGVSTPSAPSYSDAQLSGGVAGGDADQERGGEDEDVDDDDSDSDDEEDDAEVPHEEGVPPTAAASRSVSSGASQLSGDSGAASALGNGTRVVLKYLLPWAEVVTNFVDAVKSLTAGYASVDWQPGPYHVADIVKVDLLVNAKSVDALCFVAHKDKAVAEGRRVAARLKSVISRQQFEVVIQAAVGGKVIARERLAPYRKDVLIKGGKTVGGGDITRKKKLLEKQKEGKKRMKTVGNVELSQEAFHSIMMTSSR